MINRNDDYKNDVAIYDSETVNYNKIWDVTLMRRGLSHAKISYIF